MILTRKSFWMWRLGLAACVLTLLAETALPQRKGTTDEKDQLLPTESDTFSSLREGKIAWDQGHKPLLEKAARWYVYRLTRIEGQQQQPPDASGKTSNPLIQLYVQEAFKQLPVFKKGERASKQQELKFLQEFTKALVPAIEIVLTNPKPIARVNAARILARLGECGQEEAADAMLKVLADKEQSDAVKLYALRGLKELFLNLGTLKEKKRETLCLSALLDFLQRPPIYSKDAPPEEVEGFRYVRCEAVRALAQVRQPVLLKDGKMEGPQPALVLLRFVAKDGVVPEPSLTEQIEAAIGVCQLNKLSTEYQPDYAAYHLGRFLAEFAAEYQKDWERPKEPPLAPLQPWKVQIERLRSALESLNSTKPSAYVAGLIERTIGPTGLFKPMEKGNSLGNTINDYKAKVEDKAPQGPLFKSDPKSIIKSSAESAP